MFFFVCGKVSVLSKRSETFGRITVKNIHITFVVCCSHRRCHHPHPSSLYIKQTMTTFDTVHCHRCRCLPQRTKGLCSSWWCRNKTTVRNPKTERGRSENPSPSQHLPSHTVRFVSVPTVSLRYSPFSAALYGTTVDEGCILLFMSLAKHSIFAQSSKEYWNINVYE